MRDTIADAIVATLGELADRLCHAIAESSDRGPDYSRALYPRLLQVRGDVADHGFEDLGAVAIHARVALALFVVVLLHCLLGCWKRRRR